MWLDRIKSFEKQPSGEKKCTVLVNRFCSNPHWEYCVLTAAKYTGCNLLDMKKLLMLMHYKLPLRSSHLTWSLVLVLLANLRALSCISSLPSCSLAFISFHLFEISCHICDSKGRCLGRPDYNREGRKKSRWGVTPPAEEHALASPPIIDRSATVLQRNAEDDRVSNLGEFLLKMATAGPLSSDAYQWSHQWTQHERERESTNKTGQAITWGRLLIDSNLLISSGFVFFFIFFVFFFFFR